MLLRSKRLQRWVLLCTTWFCAVVASLEASLANYSVLLLPALLAVVHRAVRARGLFHLFLKRIAYACFRERLNSYTKNYILFTFLYQCFILSGFSVWSGRIRFLCEESGDCRLIYLAEMRYLLQHGNIRKRRSRMSTRWDISRPCRHWYTP